MMVETVEYVVKKKDSLWNIVKQRGFPPKDWKRIYDAPYNKKLRKLRNDPNVVLPGDRINLPRYNPMEIQALLDRIVRAERRLEETRRTRQAFLKDIQKIRARLKKRQTPDKREIEQLRKRAEGLRDLGYAAANECADMYSCIGGGLVGQMFLNEARALNKKAEKIAARLVKETAKHEQIIQEMQKAMEQLEKAEARLMNDIQKRRKEWKKASVRPY